MKRTPIKRGERPVGAAAKARRAAGGPRVKGRESLGVEPWKVLKAALYHRARGRCENPVCRKAGVLDAHHILKASAGGKDEADNLVMLCRPCHEATDLPHESMSRLGVAKAGDPETFVFFYQNTDDQVYTRPPAEPNYGAKNDQSVHGGGSDSVSGGGDLGLE